MPKFRCTVAIPTRELFSGEIDYAEIPGSEGSYGVLAGHQMMVTTTKPGILTLHLDPEGHEKLEFVTNGGFAQMTGDQLLVLARMGRNVKEIDVQDAQRKLNDLNKQIEKLQSSTSETDAAVLETSLAKKTWYELQIQVGESR